MPTRRPKEPRSSEANGLTRDQILADLYTKVTSRKLWMALVSIGLSIWSYHAGIIDGTVMVGAITAAATVYLGAQGVADAASSWGADREHTRLVTERAKAEAEQARTQSLAHEAELMRMSSRSSHLPNPPIMPGSTSATFGSGGWS